MKKFYKCLVIVFSFQLLFFIQASAQTNPGFSIKSSAYKSDPVNWIGLTVTNSNTGIEQEAYIVINPEATDGFDVMFDSEFIPGSGPLFYSLAGNEKLSTNSIPSLTPYTEISFVFMPNGSSNFQVEAAGLEMIENQVYLYDRVSKADLNLSQNPVYSFEALPGDDTTRFVLHFRTTGFEKPMERNTLRASYYGEAIHFYSFTNNDILQVCDLNGKVLHRIHSGSGHVNTFPVQLSTGIYVLRLISGCESYVGKILVN